MVNRVAFLFLFLAAALFPLRNIYLPGSVSLPRAWFPLHHTDFMLARHLADSLLMAYEKQGWVQKDAAANRLTGRTSVAPQLVEAVSGARIGEKGAVFLDGKMAGEAELVSFQLNWCDFYGALIETEYKPKGRFPADRVIPGAVFVKGPSAKAVRALVLKTAQGEEAGIRRYFKGLSPQPVEFITDITLSAFEYPALPHRLLVLVNFMTESGYAPGALYLLTHGTDSLSLVSNYFIGEKAELLQILQEPGDPHPVLEARSSGDGEEYILVRFNGKEFEAVYKRVEGEFP
ncbi:MAG: hypothetical protein V1913_07960 [Fibrobacterota bacterium]